ncbi:hypothetical protein DYB32_000304, partial [Aphanomyces invadans]
QFLQASGRKVAVVNMDPANEHLPYVANVDIAELVCLENVMDELHLGPNGAVHLVDAHHCTDSAKFISVVLLSLSSMVRLELPHINVLSKMDLIQQYGQLTFNLEFYTDVLDLRYLLDRLEAQDYGDSFDDDVNGLDEDVDTMQPPPAVAARKLKVRERFRKMHEVLIEVIEDFSLVSFVPLQIEDVDSLQRVVNAIDKSNGFVFEGASANAIAGDRDFQSERIGDMEERYVR